jgi:hypothetical protein
LDSLLAFLDVVFTGFWVLVSILVVVYIGVPVLNFLNRASTGAVSSPERDEELHAIWEAMQVNTDPHAHLIQVRRADPPARRGTRAVVAFLRTGEEVNAWFWHHEVRTGSSALVRGSYGNGSQGDRTVFYIHKVLHLLPPDSDQAIERHRRRQASSTVG